MSYCCVPNCKERGGYHLYGFPEVSRVPKYREDDHAMRPIAYTIYIGAGTVWKIGMANCRGLGGSGVKPR